MKKSFFVLFVLLTSVMNLSAGDVLSVVSNSNSGISDANYTGTLDDGSTLGFYRSGSYAYFCGAISTASSLSVPETIQIGRTQVNVTYCGRYSGETLDLDDAASVTSLTLPSTVTNIYNYIPSSVTDLHLQSTNPPSVYNNNYLKSVTIWVPESALSAYQSACNNGSKGWSTSIELHYEGWEAQSYTVTVNTPGTFGSILLSTVSQWTDVEELTVVGHLNEDDLKLLTRLKQMRKLDLSQTDITVMTGCSGLSQLQQVLLPSTVVEVAGSAFSGCSKLREIALPNVTSIGSSAFSNCSSLSSVSLPAATEIGDYAFYYCSSLSSVSLPAATEIGDDAFYYCSSLSSVSLPAATEIGYEAFYYCSSLSSVSLPAATEIGDRAFYYCSSLSSVSLPAATEIGYDAFSYCSSLSSVSLPAATEIGYEAFSNCSSLSSVSLPAATEIGYGAFYYCSSLTSVSLPACLQSLGSEAFLGCSKLQDVYCYVIVPLTTSAFSGVGSAATLHVPAFSLTAYMLHDSWYSFYKIVKLDDTIDHLTVNDNFTIVDYTGLANKIDLTLTEKAHLTVSAGSVLNLGKFTQTINYYDYNYDNYHNYSTLIAGNEVKADTVTLSMRIQTNRWNFISLPFDVNVSDIQCTEGTLWVIRKYSGADRAALSGNTWQNMNSGTTLQAGEGYILHCANENRSEVEFVFRAVNNARKNGIFAHQDVVKPLGAFPSEHAHNRGWNLVGNPYPSFYRTTSIEHNGVITVWNPYSSSWSSSGGSYTAYSLLDDDYVLRPNEAFFVQCPVDAKSMTFKADGRIHEYSSVNNDSYAREAAGMGASERQVYNVTLSDDNHSDRARVVINEKAKLDYEISCDASKFMSDNPDVPQLYVIDGDVHYAIDERPLSNGVIALGMRLGQSGSYCLQLTTKGAAGQSVVLTDKETGKQTDLTKDGYTFTAEPGISNARFTLTIGDDETAIRAIESSATSEGDAVYYDMNGRRVSGDGHGIFIVKQNGKSRKVVK